MRILFLFFRLRRPRRSTLFPYTTLFRSEALTSAGARPADVAAIGITNQRETTIVWDRVTSEPICNGIVRSEEHTSELQSRFDLVCRLLLEKKKRLAERDTPSGIASVSSP